jgi:hypothetical protein
LLSTFPTSFCDLTDFPYLFVILPGIDSAVLLILNIRPNSSRFDFVSITSILRIAGENRTCQDLNDLSKFPIYMQFQIPPNGS